MVMTNNIDNPYESPQASPVVSAVMNRTTPVEWKSIAKRWELLRIPYNVLVGLAGLVTLMTFSGISWMELVEGAVVFGICANVLYMLGPIAEMYLNWIVDLGEARYVPRRLVRLIRSRWPTTLMFILGILFAVGLTLMIGLDQALASLDQD